MNLSSIPAKLLATTLVLASTTGMVFAKGHHNYKDEPTFKDAAPCPQPPTLKDGFYLGAQAGYDSYRVRQSYSDLTSAASSVGASNGWVGGLFAGYGQYVNDMYYLAGELLANYNGNQNTIVSAYDSSFGSSGMESFEAKQTYGVSVLPGLKLNDTSLGYARLGYDWTRFEAKATGVTSSGSYSVSKSTTQGGWRFGLGIETLLANNWSARTEFNHVYYNSFNFGADSMSPSDNQFMLGVVYHFA